MSFKEAQKYNIFDLAFLFLSVACHFILLSVNSFPLQSIKEVQPTQEIKLILSQAQEPRIPPIKRQIVSPSDTVESKKTPNSNLISDKNYLVEEQTIKRGDFPLVDPPAKKSGPSNKSPKAIQATKEKQLATSKSNNEKIAGATNDKKIDAKELLASISKSTLSSFQNPAKDSTTSKNPDSDDSSPSQSSSENRINALAGTPDLLKDVRDGEMTLLNAKADRFAVFVRRVALRVFSSLKTSNWYEAGNLSKGFQTEEITIRAQLDKEGHFLNLELLQSSNNNLFDRVVIRSVKIGAWDKNPPSEALTTEGKISFIFKSKAYVVGGPRGVSRQWLMLATGLE